MYLLQPEGDYRAKNVVTPSDVKAAAETAIKTYDNPEEAEIAFSGAALPELIPITWRAF